jgi:tRNA1(Val) A37 N6-methylase TrmN6
MGFAEADLSRDDFLGGRLSILQPLKGYRAGIDPVVLAAAVPARAGDSVLELGLGAGVASLCLGARVPGLSLVGLELQPDYADLARRNAAANGVALEVLEGDLRAMPAALRARSFDHVLLNPPYYRRDAGTASQDGGRDTALAGETPLADWIDAATRRLAPGGILTLIQRADRLPDLVSALDDRLGGAELLPLQPRRDRPAERIILRAAKGRKGLFRLWPPLTIHRHDRHETDAQDYCDWAVQVLRAAAAMPWPA